MRREYPLKITVNGVNVEKVIIDLHYEGKHRESISDEIIIQLVKQLDGNDYSPDAVKGDFEYYKYEPAYLERKTYRLVWLLQKDCIYVGVVNCFRRD